MADCYFLFHYLSRPYQSCKRQAKTVVCSFLITDQDTDKTLNVTTKSRIIADGGIQYNAKQDNFAGRTDSTFVQAKLVKDVPLRAELIFENVSPSFNLLTLAEVNVSDPPNDFLTSGDVLTATLHDIAIEPQ